MEDNQLGKEWEGGAGGWGVCAQVAENILRKGRAASKTWRYGKYSTRRKPEREGVEVWPLF